jgi:hypothetical protein
MNIQESQLQHYLEIRAQDAEDKAMELGYLEKPLRFNRSRIIISDLADEFFCEASLDCQYDPDSLIKLSDEQQQLSTQQLKTAIIALDKGIEYHQNESAKSIHIEEQFVRGIYKDILLAGQVDMITFDGHTITVTDRKTKSTLPSKGRMFENHKTQLNAYSYCLRQMLGKNPTYSNLTYNIICAYSSTNGDGDKSFTEGYDSKWINNDLSFAYDYWKMKRECKPTTLKNKCNNCKYSLPCPHSLSNK